MIVTLTYLIILSLQLKILYLAQLKDSNGLNSNYIYHQIQQMGSSQSPGNNQAFMLQYDKMQSQFKSKVPLFSTNDIKFPLSTSGMKIVDEAGKRVKIAGCNWSGGHMKRHCVSGLQYQPLKHLCKEISQTFSMNCIRLTFSLEMYYTNNIVPEKYLKANKQLHNKTALQIFDQTVKTITDCGLMILLNNHTSKSQWCCSNQDGDGLWWNEQYPEEKYYECLIKMTQRYKDNPKVIGMDLRNQIRRANGQSPSWGDGNQETDWHRAATHIGNEILKIAPHWLIVVGGINYQLDLTGVWKHPVLLNIPNKLVYSGHFYGFSWPLGVWDLRSQESFRQKIFNDQLYVRGLRVPFLLGEFGSDCKDQPWTYLINLLKDTDIDWIYWCVDGYKCEKMQDETYGLWDHQYSKPRNPQILRDLKRVGVPVHGIRTSKSNTLRTSRDE